jgi:hypothetical protein
MGMISSHEENLLPDAARRAIEWRRPVDVFILLPGRRQCFGDA